MNYFLCSWQLPSICLPAEVIIAGRGLTTINSGRKNGESPSLQSAEYLFLHVFSYHMRHRKFMKFLFYVVTRTICNPSLLYQEKC